MISLPREIINEIFLQISDIRDQSAFTKTCKDHQKMFQSKLDPTSNKSMGLRWAVKNGNVSDVQSMMNIPGMDPSDNENEAICTSVERGNMEIIKLLVNSGKCDLSTNYNQPLRIAQSKGFLDIEDLLKYNGVSEKGKRSSYCLKAELLW